ncbi:MAG: acyl carrier protein [Cyanobacteria bacterium P01_E01_bin.42]
MSQTTSQTTIDTTIDKLKTIIADDLDVNLKKDDIDEDASLFEGGLGLDSIVIVELISLIEENFEIEFSDLELNPEYFSNLKVLAEFVSQKLASPEAAVV